MRRKSRIVLSGARSCDRNIPHTDATQIGGRKLTNPSTTRSVTVAHSVIFCFLYATIDTHAVAVCVFVCFASDFISLNYALASKARMHKTSGSAVPLSTTISLASHKWKYSFVSSALSSPPSPTIAAHNTRVDKTKNNCFTFFLFVVFYATFAPFEPVRCASSKCTIASLVV